MAVVRATAPWTRLFGTQTSVLQFTALQDACAVHSACLVAAPLCKEKLDINSCHVIVFRITCMLRSQRKTSHCLIIMMIQIFFEF